MIHAALVSVHSLGNAQRQQIVLDMDLETKLRYAESLSREKAFLQALGHDLLRRLLARLLHLPMQEIALRHNPQGKPALTLADGSLPTQWRFPSLSHSGSWVLACVGTRPIGCDVERERRYPPQAIAGFFSEEDCGLLAAQPQQLTQLWIRRECLIKLLGGNFDAKTAVLSEPTLGEKMGYRFYENTLPGGYRIGLAEEVGDPCLQIEWENVYEGFGDQWQPEG